MDTEHTVSMEESKPDCKDLINEKESLDPSYTNALRLLNAEIAKKESGLSSSNMIDVCSPKQIRVEVKVRIPVKEHPKFNFVGKLLGPKGNSMRRMQEETGTRMAIYGRGSMKNKAKEDELRKEGLAKHAHLNEELHVNIEVYAQATDAYQRLAHAVTEVHKYMVPDPNDGIRQEQLRELAALKGTYVEPGPPSRGGMGGGPMRGRGGPPRGGPRGGGRGFAPPPPMRGGRGGPARGGMAPPPPGPMGRGGPGPLPPPPMYGESPRGMASAPAPRGGGFGGPNRSVVGRGAARGGGGGGGGGPPAGGSYGGSSQHQEGGGGYYDDPYARTPPSSGYHGEAGGDAGGYSSQHHQHQDSNTSSGYYGSSAGYGAASDREYRGNGFQDTQSYGGSSRDSGWGGAGGRGKAPASYQDQKSSQRPHPYSRY